VLDILASPIRVRSPELRWGRAIGRRPGIKVNGSDAPPTDELPENPRPSERGGGQAIDHELFSSSNPPLVVQPVAVPSLER